MKEKSYLTLIACIGALGGFLFGYDTGMIGGALIFIDAKLHISTFEKSVLVGCLPLGALISAALSGRSADFFGRKTILMYAAFGFLFATLLLAFSQNLAQIILGRFLLGWAIGITSYVAPLYLSEIAPTELRGKSIMHNGIAIVSGQLVSLFIVYKLLDFASWRLIFTIGLIPAITFMAGVFILPESPRWLIKHGQTEKAKKLIHKIHNKYNVECEVASIKQSLKLKDPKVTLFNDSKMRGLLYMGIALGVIQQLFGMNALIYYGPELFSHVGFKTPNAGILATIIIASINLIGTVSVYRIINLVDRRQLLLTGSIIATLSMVVLGESVGDINGIISQLVALLAACSFVVGYSISIGSLFWILIAEIFPLHFRGHAMSISTAFQWAAQFVLAMSFLAVFHNYGPEWTFWGYSVVCFAGYFYFYLKVPETRGKSLEEIEYELAL